MNGLTMLHGAEPRDVLQAMIREKVPAIMSYLSKGKWHATKVILASIGAGIELQVSPGKKSRPMNIIVGQSVGISVKYGYGKFIFDSKVLSLEPPSQLELESNGAIVVNVPAEIELVQRRNYFRVRVPKSLDVAVQMWLRHYAEDNGSYSGEALTTGKLVDISAGGLQVAVDASQQCDFRMGQFVGLKFRPLPSGEPLSFNAQIRNIFPTADNRSICIGLQTVGLETSSEGRENLQRLCNVVEQYYQWGQLQTEQLRAQ